ncbi:MAG: cation transporter [Candidatus Marinimicrobia bacterium]|nr:cation transporter [Candidatus Neomarinimicrobiota bacterium]MBL7060104.1 cation transporter [Candidatus Neomarinimicrobiota bacterium]
MDKRQETLFRIALALAQITVFYNLLEGMVSVYFGMDDETLALFGFGVDSFVEVISGIGIWHMIFRIRRNENENPDRFEKTALKITGTAFYLLTAGLLVTAGLNIFQNHHPQTTFWGIVISTISLLTMWLLIHYKVKVGKELKSDAILSDANCTKVCFYLSIVLLASSIGYALTGIGGIDSAGAVLIAWFALKEGREAFEKAEGKTCECCTHGVD